MGVIVAAIAVLAGFALGAGGFWVAKHETDTLHLIDITLRRAAGELPHLDYMTPLGVLAFEPFALLHRAGVELGASFLWGQVLVAILLAPAAWWVAVRRLTTPVAIGFSLTVVLLAGAMVFGGTDPKLSLSMHYNRWAWALAFLPLLVAALPAERESAPSEGVIVGLAMVALALIKATYFLAFAPAVVAGLLLRGMARTLVVALATGVLALAGLSLCYGVSIWPAYVGDLLAVMGSDVRAAPAGGGGWSQVVLSPKYAGGTAVAVLAILMLRARAKSEPLGMVLALMLPGAYYVTYQNYGNDPIWLLFLGVVLLSLPESARSWRLGPVVGAVAIALILPVALNIALSPMRQMTQPKAVFTEMFPGAEGRTDVFAVRARMETVEGRVSVPVPDQSCELVGGAVGWMQAQAKALEAANLAGKRVFVADLFNDLWLFGDVTRLRGGAPWYYGGLPGFDEAELFVVPRCPIDKRVSGRMYERVMMQEAGIQLSETYADDLMVVYEITHIGG